MTARNQKKEQSDPDRASRAIVTQILLLEAVVHDLQSGLQGLMVQGERLVHEAARRKPDLRVIADSAAEVLVLSEMLGEITNNLRSGPAPRPRVPIDARRTVRKVIRLLATKARDVGVEIQVTEGDGPLMVTAPELLLRQVVYNLVDNAVKYSHRSSEGASTVRVTLSKTDTEMEIAVQNWGVPIAAAEIDRIFKPGYRGAAAGTSPLGAGLGLFVAQKALFEQGGSLAVKSQPSTARGQAVTTAIARLPLEAARPLP